MSKLCGEGVEIEKIARVAAEISKSLRNRVKRHLESEPFPPKIFQNLFSSLSGNFEVFGGISHRIRRIFSP
jgi:hypothetical protein